MRSKSQPMLGNLRSNPQPWISTPANKKQFSQNRDFFPAYSFVYRLADMG